MAKVDLKLIQQLRDRTGLGMMECRKALEETGGDVEKAIEHLRKRGAAVAAKRASKETTAGIVHAYIHPGEQIGVLIEINCETDFVARTADIKNLAQDLCLQIAAMRPLYLAPEDVNPQIVEKEKEVFKAQMANSGKPQAIIDQIVEGKVKKFYTDICLLKQPYIKNDQKSVEEILKELMAKTGENIKIKRFARYEVGQ